MCVMSMVVDHYEPFFPKEPWTTFPYVPQATPTVTIPGSPLTLAQWAQLLKDFRAATEAAKTVDDLTGQPDCVDPKKATLLDRVASLERRLAEIEKAVGLPVAP